MTLKEAREENKHLESELERILDKKELLWVKTQPTAIKYDKEAVMGGTRENKYETYLISVEEQQLDNEICRLQDEIAINERYIERELKIIDEYDPLIRKIIKLREEEGTIWERIGLSVGYSPSHCKRLYKIHYAIEKGKRYIEE